MPLGLHWRWERTAEQTFCGVDLIPEAPIQMAMPFLSAPPLRRIDARKSYAVALAKRTRNPEIEACRVPSIAESGDRRSGVILYVDGQPVGSFIHRGGRGAGGQLFVDPVHRGHGYGALIKSLWWLAIPLIREAPAYCATQGGLRAELGAYRRLIRGAIESGLKVPEQVTDPANERRIAELSS